MKKAISGLFRICVALVSCWGCLSALKELCRELLMFDQVCAGRGGESSPSLSGPGTEVSLCKEWNCHAALILHRHFFRRKSKDRLGILFKFNGRACTNSCNFFCVERSGDVPAAVFFVQLMATGLL